MRDIAMGVLSSLDQMNARWGFAVRCLNLVFGGFWIGRVYGAMSPNGFMTPQWAVWDLLLAVILICSASLTLRQSIGSAK